MLHPSKRCRDISEHVTDYIHRPLAKRSRHHNHPEHITRLSDEILLRIASFLDTQDLISFQRVSRRFQRIAVDPHVWKELYHRRFVRPRASRFVGLRRQHQHLYNARSTKWLDDKGIAQSATTDWKALYKLRHNWNKGSCGVREINIIGSHSVDKASMTDDEDAPSTTLHSGKADCDHELEGSSARTGTHSPPHEPTWAIPSMLVKLHEGVVFTVDLTRGLCAWRLRNYTRHPRGVDGGRDNLIATQDLSSEVDGAAPTALAVDEECTDDGIANVTVGFDTGAFAVYQLDISMSENAAGFRTRYKHAAAIIQDGSSTAITAMAMLGPYLSVMRGQAWTIYDFSRSRSCSPVSERGVARTTEVSGNAGDTGRQLAKSRPEVHTTDSTCRMIPAPPRRLHAPQILSSLLSRTVWPPLSLSLRRSANRDVLLASIVYAFPCYVSGWSVGIQELRFQGITKCPAVTSADNRCTTPPSCTSRIATAVAPGFASAALPARDAASGSAGSRSQSYPPPPLQPVPLARPTSLSYSHPYLLSSHSDNTLTLYLVRSSDTNFEIDTGQRLYGHTSGVASVQVASRGKAISLSANGREVRVWELEGGVSEKRRVSASVRIQPTTDQDDELKMQVDALGESGSLGGFDDEKVVVAVDAQQLLVYDFTR